MKNQSIKDFNVLAENVEKHLEKVLRYSPETVEKFSYSWNLVRRFMTKNNIKRFSRDVGVKILASKFGKRTYKDLNYNERARYNGVDFLIQFHEKGKIERLPRRPRVSPQFTGSVGREIQTYLSLRESIGISDSRLRQIRRGLYIFWEFCAKERITTISQLKPRDILSFIRQLRVARTVIGLVTSSVRNFAKYLFDEGLIKMDLRAGIPRQHNLYPRKLPDRYSVDELKVLIRTHDKTGTSAKRDLAIILMSVQFGLRPSDVANLKFENIKWETNKIVLSQPKTGKLVVKELTPEVGNALLDYVQSGRPASNENQYVFLSELPPKPAISADAVAEVIAQAFRSSNVNPNGRSVYPKVLRYSYTSRLLKGKIPYHAIAQGLGHSTTRAVDSYASIDIDLLKECILEVPPIPKSFYKKQLKYYYEHAI